MKRWKSTRYSAKQRRVVGLGHYLPVSYCQYGLLTNVIRCRDCHKRFGHLKAVYKHSCVHDAFESHPLNHSQYVSLLNVVDRHSNELRIPNRLHMLKRYADAVCSAKTVPDHHILRRLNCNSYPHLGITSKFRDRYRVSSVKYCLLVTHGIVMFLFSGLNSYDSGAHLASN